MRISFSTFALAGALSTASAQVYKGFNYGSTFTNNAPVTQQDFENRFNTAKQLQGTSGFTSARLFTTIQAGTPNFPTSAIPAAIATRTQLLLGIFLSSTEEAFNNEQAALRSAISQYGQAFADLVIGISVGSEDLYRISPIGIENLSNPGEGPDAVVSRINAVRSLISGTALQGKPVGHVDTWTAYVNASNSAVIEACDFVGMDAYPYFQNTQANSIENGESLFFDAYNATVSVSRGKPVWITETGWPVSGPNQNQAVASLANARTYWERVGCRVFGQITTFWYTLQDAFPDTPSPSFGVVGTTLSNTPLYDLSCPDSSSSSSSSGSSTATSAVASSGATGTSSGPSNSETSPATSDSSNKEASGVGASTTPPVQSPSVTPAVPNTVANIKTVMTYTTITTCPVTYTEGTETKTSLTSSAVVVTSTHVDKNHPDTAANTGFNGVVSPTVSSIFNFDLPPSYEGRTCSLVFLFPTRESLQTSNFTLSGSGGLEITRLLSPATAETTYNNQPAVNITIGSVPDLQAGNSYTIGSGRCLAERQRVGYKVSATGSLDLNYFQDFNPSPIGLYVTVC
ncbi:MAG: hypothetical protein LQ346_004570 [Caloplaca aetnensis]|nr:MAG: hypothetical protein LQ346_004570 [Caloplaca aetnensis]